MILQTILKKQCERLRATDTFASKEVCLWYNTKDFYLQSRRRS